ncbi:hypothetical protein VTN00DRAFT_9334 [Thermoascus crustaceus]|uniref:uncharacterized protein n=1 Tax=Thermoascus crustaceus TaxID=5088 RepID=UPI003742E477
MSPAVVQENGCQIDGTSQEKPIEPVAIVGMACRFPGDASDVSSFWKLLCEARSAWSDAPEDRFRQHAFFHPESKTNGTFYCQGGHFLTEDVSRFDAPFFHISPAEAKAMDPQQRLLLEVAYEAFENSGIPLERLRGTDTSAYVAIYGRDYEKLLFRDPENMPFYQATGNGDAIFSNRLSYFFDLRGPSFTLDTGCSGSLVALHSACQSIRSGESRQAIVGAANLILDPSPMIAPSFLNFFSTDGRSYAFDHRANGYGRGEGVSCVVLKSLSEALKDGDNIRAVIRSSVVNQDGKTLGITAPNQRAQEALIRKAYSLAHLDPADTVYVEAHGTGTAVGDLTESSVLGSIFGRARKARGPVPCGSVKTNIGHLESASGMAGLLKAALVVEKGVIPPNLNFEKVNPSIRLREWNLEVPTKLQYLSDSASRQVSVNSFGYGGTNAHVILDRLRNTDLIWGAPEPAQQQNHSTNGTVSWTKSKLKSGKNYIFVLSARSEESGQAMVSRLGEYLGNKSNTEMNEDFLGSLAHTLCNRRSVFPWKTSVVASSIEELQQHCSRPLSFVHCMDRPNLVYAFTGQGFHWHAMGRELLESNPIFRSSILRAEQFFLELGANWKITDELCRPPSTCRLGAALICQPICTAIQLALVDLLAAWNVFPEAVVGHSSGEIAAAYACKAISFGNALFIAYSRGIVAERLAENRNIRGSMMAVALSEQEALRYIRLLPDSSGKVNVACINSPSSVTLSGDYSTIVNLYKLFQEHNIRARQLDVQVAYHSHHMLHVADDYMKLLTILSPPASNPSIPFFSSVDGDLVDGANLTADYWAKNLVSPVLFSHAVENLCRSLTAKEEISGKNQRTSLIIEIGPHAGLRGPINQILSNLQLPSAKFRYSSALVKDRSAILSTCELASDLFSNGYPVDLNAINFGGSPSRSHETLVDLPPYPWNHSNSYWHESRISRNYRNRQDPRHELLGVLCPDSSHAEPRWRNYLRLSEMPWLSGHKIRSQIIFPGAAYMCMAFEAGAWYATHVLGLKGNFDAIRLSQVSFTKALVVPKSEDGIEVTLVLRPSSESLGRDLAGRHEFVVYSFPEGQAAVEHCRGFMSILTQGSNSLLREQNCDESNLRQIDVAGLYSDIGRLGVFYSKHFKGITHAAADSGRSTAIIDVHRTGRLSKEYRKLSYLHPATLDSCMQTIFPAVMSDDTLSGPMLPTFVQEASLLTLFPLDSVNKLQTTCQVERPSTSQYKATITSCSTEASLSEINIISLIGLEAKAIGNMARRTASESSELGQKIEWVLDPEFLTATDIIRICSSSLEPASIARELSQFGRASHYYIKMALRQLTDADRQSMKPFHREFVEWMEEQASQDEKVSCSCCHDPDHIDSLIEALERSGSEGKVICRIGRNLASILRGQQDPLSLMMEDGLLHSMYREDKSVQRSSLQAAEFVKLLGRRDPGLRIIEIGAGTGGTTVPVLSAISPPGTKRPLLEHYTFTDISSGFFPKAEETLSQWKGLVSFQKLNIERDPHHQGFEKYSYDVVIASNVLHATANIGKTMENVRSLLKPGGKLVLVESTRQSVHRALVFGTLPGWWLGSKERRRGSPLLSVDEWDSAMKASEFSGVDVYMHTYERPEEQIDSLMISTALNSHEPAIQERVQILLSTEQFLGEDGGSGRRLAETLSKSLGPAAGDIVSLGDISIRDKTCVCLAEVEKAVFHDCSEQAFNALKETLGMARKLIWVTRGATYECSNPESSLVIGLARVVRRENPNVEIKMLDLDANGHSQQTLVDSIVRFLNRHQPHSMCYEHEWTERDGKWLVPRLMEDGEVNRFLSLQEDVQLPCQLEPFHQPDRVLRLVVGQSKTLQDLHFVEDNSLQRPLAKDEVEIDVRASGVNFRDVMILLGQLDDELRGECSGIVVDVGEKVKEKFTKGDRVWTWHVSAYTGRVRAKAYLTSRIPDHLSFEEAASLPIIYGTAYHALVNVAALKKGETVLIHAGAGGVGQAAIVLALHLGAEIYATVGSDEKRNKLVERYGLKQNHIFSSRSGDFVHGIKKLTNGAGVDVVLNSLAGPRLQDSLDVVAPFGRFVEIGKADTLAGARMDMSVFNRSISFTSLDLAALPLQKPQYTEALFSKVHEMIEAGIFVPPSPVNIFPVSKIQNAFRLIQSGKHIGKVVISYGTDDKVLAAPKKPEPIRFSPDATYVVSGGQGGLGRALCLWMAESGAKHIVILSPSGSTKQSTQKLIKQLADLGTELRPFACDVGNREQLKSALSMCRHDLPPIRGLIQAALVLKDGIFESMTVDDYNKVLGPKVSGTYNLHDALQSQSLDFFLILSSYCGIVGNPGQANYSAASTFQDAFARWRTSKGLPTRSIDLGAILGAGYVHENAGALEHLSRQGSIPVPVKTFLNLTSYAISQPVRSIDKSQIGIGWSAQVKDNSQRSWSALDRRFSHLRTYTAASNSEATGSEYANCSAEPLEKRLASSKSQTEATTHVAAAISEQISKILGVPLKDVDPGKSISAHGADSLIAAEFRNWFSRTLGFVVSTGQILGALSVRELAEMAAADWMRKEDASLRREDHQKHKE